MYRNLVKFSLAFVIVGLFTSSCCKPEKQKSQKYVIPEQDIHVAISFHDAVFDELEAQVLWLHRHLELVLSTLEAQHQLEPTLIWTTGIDFKSYLYHWFDEPQIPLSLLDDPNCFVRPYQRPAGRQYEDGAFENEKMEQTFERFSKEAVEAGRKLRELELRIDNIHKRLERLEPLVKTP